MAPAIKLAREGFPLYTRLRGGMQFKKDAFLKTPDATRVYLVNGEVPEVGYVIRQPELAAEPRDPGQPGCGRLLQGRIREEARRGREAARRQLDRGRPG
jgi:gamma-glutamyltranspeptidase/glutathione hydrolase